MLILTNFSVIEYSHASEAGTYIIFDKPDIILVKLNFFTKFKLNVNVTELYALIAKQKQMVALSKYNATKEIMRRLMTIKPLQIKNSLF